MTMKDIIKEFLESPSKYQEYTNIADQIFIDDIYHDDLFPDNMEYNMVQSHEDFHDPDGFWMVVKFTNKETNESVYVKICGYYKDDDSLQYHHWFFVKPITVNTVKYVKDT